MDLRIESVENSDSVAPADEFIDDERADESHTTSDEDMFVRHRLSIER